MYKFRIGDKVKRIKNDYNGMHVGDIGTITKVLERGNLSLGFNLNLEEYGYGHDSLSFKISKISNPNSDIVIKR